VTKTYAMYNCQQCGVANRKVIVPARPSEMNVTKWVHATMRLLGMDHHLIAPLCASIELDLMLPLKHDDGSEREWVGQEDK
jgi:hypothetical protein